MYKISTRGQYALLIMEDLAEADADKYVLAVTTGYEKTRPHTFGRVFSFT